MKVKELKKLGFQNAVEILEQENDTITTYETLTDFAKNCIDNDNLFLAIHILKAIWEDTTIGETNYYSYDYTCGTCDKPKPITTIEDLEEFCED